jgi:hypothetical protein
MANDFDTDMNDDDDPSGDTFDVNDFIDGKKPKVAKEPKEVPMYQVYADSKIPVSKAYGSLWRTMIDSSLKANELIYEAWEQCFSY